MDIDFDFGYLLEDFIPEEDEQPVMPVKRLVFNPHAKVRTSMYSYPSFYQNAHLYPTKNPDELTFEEETELCLFQ